MVKVLFLIPSLVHLSRMISYMLTILKLLAADEIFRTSYYLMGQNITRAGLLILLNLRKVFLNYLLFIYIKYPSKLIHIKNQTKLDSTTFTWSTNRSFL